LCDFNLSDEQLIKNTSDGDEKAFEELYRRYEGKVMGFLTYKLRNSDAAHDAFQTVWSKVVKNSHKFKPDHRFSSWLMTIASNQVKDWFKASANYSKLLRSYSREQNENLNVKTTLPDLSFLKNQSQEILQLRYIQGLSSNEVANKLNLSEANVRKISSRALKEIKTHVQNGGSL